MEDKKDIGGINYHFRYDGEEYAAEIKIYGDETAESVSVKVSNAAYALISKMLEVGAIQTGGEK